MIKIKIMAANTDKISMLKFNLYIIVEIIPPSSATKNKNIISNPIF